MPYFYAIFRCLFQKKNVLDKLSRKTKFIPRLLQVWCFARIVQWNYNDTKSSRILVKEH